MATQRNFSFTNRFYNAIPVAYQYAKVSPFSNNHLVCVSPAALTTLHLDDNVTQEDDFLAFISGQKLPEQGYSIAQVYAGHQFGQFVPQLGDGRALGIGEIQTPDHQYYELQLKGAGVTPYSRHGDGRAVLRSTIREFLASEALHHLNIPTTRALAITSTSDVVYREKPEPGAILTRFAESHIRFGHFEYFFHSNDIETLNQIADFCLTHYFTEANDAEDKHLAMLLEIVKRTAHLIAKWQSVGFTHGVLNTDNMSILGLTIDYGPFGFLDTYQPAFISNQSDHTGRYAFEQQPSIGLWNLNALAYTFSTWLSATQIRGALATYEQELVEHYNELMVAKLGIEKWQDSDSQLLGQLFALMEQQQADYTRVFRMLNQVSCSDQNNQACQALLAEFSDSGPMVKWLESYRPRLLADSMNESSRIQRQNNANPKYILRNYLAQSAIQSAYVGDYQEISQLTALLSKPFDEQVRYNAYANTAPDWSKELNISCSS